MAESLSVRAVLSAVDRGFMSTFGRAESAIGSLQSRVTSGLGFGFLSGMGQKAFETISNSVRAMTSTVMDSGMSFEAAGSQIAATMGKSKSEITDIINEAARLGATTSFTATQAAQGFNVLAMSGLKAEEQIAAMEPVLHLAEAGAYSMDAAASQVVGTIKGFGDEFSNAEYYADMFAKGATLASTDVNMLGTAMSDSAALAASYGQKADRTCIALLRLAEQNVTGSEAATAMSRAMADLYTPTDAAAKKLAELGVKVYEDSGEARDFNNVVDDLNKAMSGMTDEERKAAEAAIFTSYGMKAFDKMCVSSTKKVHEFEEGLRSATGSAAQQASEQLNNLKGDITIFGSAMEGLGVTIFTQLSPAFRSIVQAATEMITGINNGLAQSRLGIYVENAVKYFNVFMVSARKVGAAFGQAFSAVGAAFAKLTSDFGSLKSVKSFGETCHTVSESLVSLAGTIEANADTIAKLITAVPKAAAAFLTFKSAAAAAGTAMGAAKLLTKYGGFSALPGIVSAGTSALGGLATRAGSIPGLLSRIPGGLSRIRDGALSARTSFANMIPMRLQDPIFRAVQAVGSLKTKAVGAVGSIGSAIGSGANGIWERIVPSESLRTKITSAFGTIGTTMGKGVTTAANTGMKVGTTALSGMTRALGAVIQLGAKALVPTALIGAALVGLGALHSAFGDKIDEIIQMVATKGPEVISKFVSGITSKISELLPAGAQMLTGLLNAITVNIPSIVQGAVAIVGALVEGVNANSSMLLSSGLMLVTTLITSLLEAIPQLLIMGVSILLSLSQGILDNLPQIVSSGTQIIMTLANGITQNLPQIVSMGLQVIMNLAQAAISALPQLLTVGMLALAQVVTGIAQQIPQILTAAVQIVQMLVSGIAQNAPQLITSAGQLLISLIQGIATCLPQIITAGLQIVVSLVSGLIQALPDIAKAGWELIKSLGSAIVEAIPNIITGAVEGIKGIFTDLWGFITGKNESGNTDSTSTWNSIESATSAASTAASTTAQTQWGAMSASVSSSNAAMLGSTSSSFAAMSTDVQSAASSSQASMDSLAASITASTSSASASLAGLTPAASAVDTSFNSTASAVTSAGSTISTGMSSAGTQVQSSLSTMATSAGQSGNQFATNLKNGTDKATSNTRTAVSQITATMNHLPPRATVAGRTSGSNFSSGIASGGSSAVSVASGLSQSAAAAMNSGYGSAYAAGSYIGQGLANGLASQAGAVAAQAAALAAAANAAIAAKAQIGSPSKITTQYGKWYGQGFVNGISDMASKTRRASEKLVSFPTKTLGRQRLNFGAVNSELGADYTYDSAINVTVVSELDGREIARGTYRYIDGEIQKSERRESRKRGQSA